MTTLPPDRIFKGYWVNHVEGPIFGATITLKTSSANILIAGMSLLIAVAGEHLWGIMTFAYYSFRANDSPRDRLFYQRQLLVRNVATPGSALLYMTNLYWKTRQHVESPHLRLMPIALLAAACGAVVVVASTLSSQIMETSDIKVLVQSPTCGFVDPAADLWYDYLYTATEQGLRYSRSCYNESTTDPAGQLYVTHGIPFETVYVPCPFGDLCALSENSAIRMDTGRMNSNTVLGINAKRNDAIDIRKITTCAPLDLSRYEAIQDMDDAHARYQWDRPHLPGEQMLTWDLGRKVSSLDFNQTLFPESWFMSLSQLYTSNSYVPKFLYYNPPAGLPVSGNFDPIPPFVRDDADTVVAIIGFGTSTYDTPVDDPVFAAHQNASYVSPWGVRMGSSGGFKSDKAAGAIGCFEQFQLCLPNGDCTVPSSLNHLILQAYELELTGAQNATMYLFGWPAYTARLDISIASRLQPQDMLVATKATHIWPFSLPSNQWEIEVKAWEAMVLTELQKLSSDVAVGADVSGSDFKSIPLLPPGPAEDIMCHSQKMIAPAGFSNVSVFGLALIVAVCLLLILVNMTLIETLRRLARLSHSDPTVLEQWDEDEMLHVQRKLLETHGMRDWSTVMSRAALAVGNTSLVLQRSATPAFSNEGDKGMTDSAVVVSEITSRDDAKDVAGIESRRLLESSS